MFPVNPAAYVDYVIPVVRFRLIAVASDGGWQQWIHRRFYMIRRIRIEQVNVVRPEFFDAVVDRGDVFPQQDYLVFHLFYFGCRIQRYFYLPVKAHILSLFLLPV